MYLFLVLELLKYRNVFFKLELLYPYSKKLNVLQVKSVA